MDHDLLPPTTDPDGAPFWDYTSRHELRVQSCRTPACQTLRFPPRPCCPHCHSFDTEWRRMTGQGRIWSYVIPHPPLLPAYAEQAPYNVAVVELTDAPHIRLVGNVVASPAARLDSVPPDRLRIGAKVQAVYWTTPDGTTIPRWMLERP
ncbi:Zn-ribbon domain-containing OB-fold protein [Streptomyces beihaiensis]|uniref:OB-fold domain-containing protein n=1 Tax=Streptomyces beihaiensis TaxID=2984495 RepID=A0ABT3TXU5_9ACTN|nr:OB-fold domain-containing protein [Streptomyces beihaiensis]MCX3061321.1 OB-fold domain-containing protein [Streptomyces beihaiensis]